MEKNTGKTVRVRVRPHYAKDSKAYDVPEKTVAACESHADLRDIVTPEMEVPERTHAPVDAPDVDDSDDVLDRTHRHEERMEELRQRAQDSRAAADRAFFIEVAKVLTPLVQAAGAGIVKMHADSLASQERAVAAELKMAVEAKDYAVERLRLRAAGGGLLAG